MEGLNTFLDRGLIVNVRIDPQSAVVLGLAIFMALVLALFLYSRFK